MPRRFDAILLDLDGTLVDDSGAIRPRTLARLRELDAAGVRVMLSTGRSESGAIPVLRVLGFDTPAVVFNGAGLYCPVQGRLLEERLLAEEAVRRSLELARREALLPVSVQAGAKYALAPRTRHEESAIRHFHGIRIVESEAELPLELVIRVTLFSDRHPSSDALYEAVEAALDRPAYVTHFPLNVLADHRTNPLLVADVQPPCRGKAEALRVLEERYGIVPERVVAVGDASNDVPMLEAAGLGIAMENSMAPALAAADRVIGDNNTDAIAELLDELF